MVEGAWVKGPGVEILELKGPGAEVSWGRKGPQL